MAVFSFPVPKRFHPPDSRSLLGERPPSFQRSEAGRLGSVWTAGPVGTPGGSFHGFHVRVWKAARRRDLQIFSGERRKNRGNLPVLPQKANRTTSLPGGGPQAVTKSKDFSDSLQKCRYFCAPQRRKSPRFACRNPCTARLPGHLSPLEAGGCPLELPRPDSGGFYSAQVLRETEDHLPSGRRSDVLSFSPPLKDTEHGLCFLFQNAGPLEPYSAPLSRS